MKNFKQFIQEMSPDFVKQANKTSRTLGAIGAKALVPRHVAEIAKPEHKVLDFGAGKDAAHAQRLRSEHGLNVTAHEFGDNQRKGVHDPNALNRRYHVVYASNVLNVQGERHPGDREMFKSTIKQIHGALHKGGSFVGNFPASPRYNSMTADDVHQELGKHFSSVERVKGKGTKQAPVFHCKK